MLHLLAIDPATHMGIARFRAPGEITSGVVRLRAASVAERLAQAEDRLTDELRSPPALTALYVEDFHGASFAHSGFSNAKAIEFLTMLKGIIMTTARRHAVPVHFVADVTWRKTFLGQGRVRGGRPATKAAAMERCRLLGWQPATDDEADALGLLYHAMCVHDPVFGSGSTDLFRAGRTRPAPG